MGELLECGDDDSLNLIHAKLQNVIEGESRHFFAQHVFFERYKRMYNILQIHCVFILEPFGRKRGFEFIATVRAADRQVVPLLAGELSNVISLRIEDVQVSVFVDVGELRDGSQNVSRIKSVVGGN